MERSSLPFLQVSCPVGLCLCEREPQSVCLTPVSATHWQVLKDSLQVLPTKCALPQQARSRSLLLGLEETGGK